MKPVTIHIHELSTGYAEKKEPKIVASHLCATIHSGELTCLLGANGVGKSTLLRTLSAFQPPLEGKIEILGKPLSGYTDAEMAKVIGVVLTEKCEIRNMNVEELVGMGRSPYTGFWGKLSRQDKEIVRHSIELVKIEELSKRMVQTLSDGERQKVMIAKALAQETPIIFLDEPTAFLDFPSKVEIMQLLHRLSRETGKTIFMSTHDLELALQIADKIWLMDKSNGLTIGTPEDLSLNGNLSNFFARKGIYFDMESGLFRIDNEYQYQLRLSGCGHKYAMIRKALQRNGILANRHIESAFSIETNIKTNDFILHLPEEASLTLRSIEALLEEIERRKPSLQTYISAEKKEKTLKNLAELS